MRTASTGSAWEPDGVAGGAGLGKGRTAEVDPTLVPSPLGAKGGSRLKQGSRDGFCGREQRDLGADAAPLFNERLNRLQGRIADHGVLLSGQDTIDARHEAAKPRLKRDVLGRGRARLRDEEGPA
jgi:hypothetical protein